MSTDPYSSPESGAASGEISFKAIGCLGSALLVGGILVFLVVLSLPSPFRRGMPAAKRTQCKNNLKQIGLALHHYHEVYNSFPPAFTVDENGTKLHSWRALILPYMEQKKLYDSIDFSKPWNDPVNAEVCKTRPRGFACPSSDIADTHTTYMGLVGDDHFFASTGSHAISDFTGGTSYAIAVTEVSVDRAVHWMEPTDVATEFLTSMNPDDEVAHTGGFQILLGDGSVRFMSLNTAPETVAGLVSISETPTGEW